MSALYDITTNFLMEQKFIKEGIPVPDTRRPIYLFNQELVKLIKQRQCTKCKKDVEPAALNTDILKKEYGISGMCACCQNAFFAPPKKVVFKASVEIFTITKLNKEDISGDWGATVRGDTTDNPDWCVVAGRRIGAERSIFQAWRKIVQSQKFSACSKGQRTTLKMLEDLEKRAPGYDICYTDILF